MFVIRRNQIIITALVVMIAVAGYLNYADRSDAIPDGMVLNDNGEIVRSLDPEDEVIGTSKTLSSALEEIGTALSTDDNPEISMVDTDGALVSGESGNEPGEAVFVNTSSDTSYFVQAKLTREQARSKQKDLLMEMINDSNIDQTKRAECADAMLEIQKRIEKETAAEAMIEAKGFKEVYVRIDDTTVDVVVNKEELSDAEIAQIEDIVKRKTGMNSDQIRISPMKH